MYLAIKQNGNTTISFWKAVYFRDDIIIFIHTEFTCISGVKSYANGRIVSDTTELETCVTRGRYSPKCYQLSLEMTMNAGVGRQGKEYILSSFSLALLFMGQGIEASGP